MNDKIVPGDLVKIVGIEFPKYSGKISSFVGLYHKIGCPDAHELNNSKNDSERFMILRRYLCGRVSNNTLCTVIAVLKTEHDDRSYYCLLPMGRNSSLIGWSRVSIRMVKINP